MKASRKISRFRSSNRARRNRDACCRLACIRSAFAALVDIDTSRSTCAPLELSFCSGVCVSAILLSLAVERRLKGRDQSSAAASLRRKTLRGSSNDKY